MTVALLRARNLRENSIVRLEREGDRWVGYIGASEVGVVCPLGLYHTTAAPKLEGFCDMVYCRAIAREGIALLCELIPPTAFSLQDIKENLYKTAFYSQ